MIVDDFPEFYLTDEDYSENVLIIRHGIWGGPNTPEVIAARIQGLKDTWTAERRAQASQLMAQQQADGMNRATELSSTHKNNIGKGMKGNSNKTGKPGRNQYSKD